MANKPSSPQYQITGIIKTPAGKVLPKLSIRAFDQDPSSENLLGEAQTNAQGKYTITYTDETFRIEGKESGGANIIVRVYEGETFLKETEPLRNAGRSVNIDVILDQPEVEPVLNPRQLLRLNNLSQTLGSNKLRNDFETIFSAAEGDWKVALDTLKTKPEFKEATIQKLAFAHEIAELTEDHSPLVQAFSTNKKINSLRDIALNYNVGSLKELVKTGGTPIEEAGESEEEKLEKYTRKIHTRLFELEPTATLLRMVADSAEKPISDKITSGTVATFLGNQPTSFNIKTTSIYEAFKQEKAFDGIPLEQQEGIKTELKTLQRVVAISPVPEAIPVLMKAKMHTAFQVSEMPEGQFIQAFKGQLGADGEAIAKQVHVNAVNARIRNEHALIALKEAGQGTGIAFIDKSLKRTVAGPVDVDGTAKKSAAEDGDVALQAILDKHNLSWDLLFGDADFCECGECTSVYSAAAYFVELLQYLRNNNLDPNAKGTLAINKTDPKSIKDTPLEKLLVRRPDLGCLQLTCANTNTILPYVDLVNEVMEHYVAFPKSKLKAFNVEEETSGELLAQPQHTEYQAYCILKDEVYPFTLPYHQPIDAARINLEFLGTSRTELMDTFRSPRKAATKPVSNDQCDTDTLDPELVSTTKEKLDQSHKGYLNRAVDAEYLGLTQEEYVILTKEAFVSKAYWDELSVDHTEEEYQQKIGLKTTPAYYGYEDRAGYNALEQLNDSSDGDGLTFVKKQFLPRTGIEYIDLVELLKTQCLNPNMPRGKAKVITESLHFSYRFLQDFKIKHGEEELIQILSNSERLIQLFPYLKDQATFFNLSSENGDLACSAIIDEVDKITESDIRHWVKCHFDRIGKMIVLENGRECACKDGILTLGSWEKIKIKIEACKIYSWIYHNDESSAIEVGNIDKDTGQINIIDVQSELYFKENYSGFNFIGKNGEQGGLILNSKNNLILVDKLTNQPFCFSQKDTCNLDTVRLIHLDGKPVTVEEYDHIHRFIRLWRKMGWTIDEVDKALVGLSTSKGDGLSDELLGANEDKNGDDLFDASGDCTDCEEDCGDDDSQNALFAACEITPEFLHQLVAVRKLLDKTGLELTKLLTFWTKISTAGDKSLYKRLFLTHNLLGMDKIFKADRNGNYLTQDAKISDHSPVIMAAFNLSADDIDVITTPSIMTDKLTLANLSLMYRYRLLSKALGLKIPAFISILPLFGDPFKSAHATLTLMESWGKMEDAGFNYRQLNYLIQGIDDPQKPLAPTEKTVLQLAKTLYDGLNAIDEAHKDLAANPETTNLDLQAQEIQAQASIDLVRSKAALLFDPSVVEQITGILEGTHVFTTNAPENLSFTIAEDKSLKKKLKYDKAKRIVQITGLLTEAEIIDFKALSSDEVWSSALTRIEKQQSKLFKVVLYDVFEAEKATSPERKTTVETAETIIKAGDINVVYDPSVDDQTNTAAPKRVAFLKVFLPYLRQQLTHRFVVDTLSGSVGLERTATDLLISDILRTGTPAEPIYTVFEKIKDSATTTPGNWRGYLIPAAEGDYTFIVKNGSTTTSPGLSIEGTTPEFKKQEDPTNEWWSKPQKLQAGKLYKLSVVGLDLKNVYWKTATSSIAAIPSGMLLPDFASDSCTPAFILLKKAALLVSGFNLSVDEIRHFNSHQEDFDGFKFHGVSPAQWLRVEAYTRLRNSLPETKTNILAFLDWTTTVQSPAEKAKLSEKIAELTLWKKERIDKLIKAGHFNLDDPANFRNEENLLNLQKAVAIADKIGMDIDLLFDWAKPTSNFKKCRNIADSIEKAIRAQYNQNDWEQVVKPLTDKLRNNQKDALIAYLLQQPELQAWGVTDADGLFEYFLIDVQMDACMETSRIKQAISSVQLFIMRCFLGLEEKKAANGDEIGVSNDVLDRPRWEWMERYRVWEANRKVFLYPENWIESNLRDDKSPFFKELESELLQKDINKQNVTDALKSYLYKVDEVANMEVVGLYIERKIDQDGITSKPSKLHIFSRTRHAPYFFYYRYFDLLEKNWYAWEKIQVDIPSYNVENSDGVVTDNGCYLTPVVWNGRLLIFFPQIMKKTKPSPNSQTGRYSDLANHESGIQNSKPIEYWEIKMAWSEYRNGKWTQKQVSSEALTRDILLSSASSEIEKFTFIPLASDRHVVIYIKDPRVVLLRQFIFSGSLLIRPYINDFLYNLVSNMTVEFGGATVFQKVSDSRSNKIKSIQALTSRLWGHDGATFTESEDSVLFDYPNSSITASKFYHPNSNDLLNKITLGQLDVFFKNTTITDKPDAFGAFDHDNDITTLYIYHELKRPYSLYNWELFFHTPMMLAEALSKAQQFEEAMKWYHFVFNPLAEGTDDTRFWQFSPFKDLNSQRILDAIFNSLQPNQADPTINEWRNHPFMPHLVARSRPVAYMKLVVMKYIDNLVAWGDYLFRQDTIESINQATQLYILAGHILGPRPMMIPKRGKTKPQTYLGLLDKWDAFGNAMVELELSAPFSNQITTPTGSTNSVQGFANVFGFSTALYFCIPNNPKLTGYWDTVADRLFKIRHCLNIEGIFRKLPLFEPPIDPGLLVKAAAQGLSIASVLNDLNTPMPNYRFYYLLQKSLELCGELKALGGALLSAIEKKDNETIALIRAKHESTMHNLVMEVKKQQLEEAQKSLETLQQNRKAPVDRMLYYLKLSGLAESLVPGENIEFTGLPNEVETPVEASGLKVNKFEQEEMGKSHDAHGWQMGANSVEALSAIFHALPDATIAAMPFGIGAQAKYGGSHLGNAATAASKVIQIISSQLSFESSNAGKKGGFTRAIQDRIQQASAAGYEIKQIDKQITAQLIRIDIANLEIANQQKQIDNANEVEEFLKNKYTNDELYTWMRGSLKTLYHQVYSLAYDLAKKSEKVYRFERGLSNSNFIQAGYWDAGRDGLLAGEQLYVGLKQLEAAYQENRGHDYELTKHISLRQINPLAVLQLKETGKCEFALPEVLFDMDYPGHYKRRIKAVSISIPCIAGPYTGLNGTLRLLENKFRNSAIAKDKTDYLEKTEESDERFSTYIIPITSIAASSAQNDSGMFELNFKDERYLPFEGAGAISKWRLELPAFRQFDYDSISDVVLQLRYTANEGGERLKQAAGDTVVKFIKQNEELGQQEGLFAVIDLKHDLPNQWHMAMQVKEGDTERTLVIPKVQSFLPFYVLRDKDGKPRAMESIWVTDVVLVTPADLPATDLFVVKDGTEIPFGAATPVGSAKTFAIREDINVGDWVLAIKNVETIDKAMLVLRFVLK